MRNVGRARESTHDQLGPAFAPAIPVHHLLLLTRAHAVRQVGAAWAWDGDKLVFATRPLFAVGDKGASHTLERRGGLRLRLTCTASFVLELDGSTMHQR